jgi:hypothetical protein
MVPMPPARDGRPDERLAVTALERLAPVDRSPPRPRRRFGVPPARSFRQTAFSGVVVIINIAEVPDVLVSDTWQGNVLQTA